jgi:hypothetical protein
MQLYMSNLLLYVIDLPNVRDSKMGGRGSGRSGHYEELDFAELVKKSLTIQLRFFDDPKIPDEKKVEYASRYLAKRVGEKIDLTVEHTLNLDEIRAKLLSLRKKEIEYRPVNP